MLLILPLLLALSVADLTSFNYGSPSQFAVNGVEAFLQQYLPNQAKVPTWDSCGTHTFIGGFQKLKGSDTLIWSLPGATGFTGNMTMKFRFWYFGQWSGETPTLEYLTTNAWTSAGAVFTPITQGTTGGTLLCPSLAQRSDIATAGFVDIDLSNFVNVPTNTRALVRFRSNLPTQTTEMSWWAIENWSIGDQNGFNFTVASPTVLPDWGIAVSSAVTTDNRIDSCMYQDPTTAAAVPVNLLGGYATLGTQKGLIFTYDFNDFLFGEITITFKFWVMGSWDDELAFFLVNSKEVWSQTFTGDKDLALCPGSALFYETKNQFVDVTVKYQFVAPVKTLTLEWKTALDEQATNEAMAVSGLTIALTSICEINPSQIDQQLNYPVARTTDATSQGQCCQHSQFDPSSFGWIWKSNTCSLVYQQITGNPATDYATFVGANTSYSFAKSYLDQEPVDWFQSVAFISPVVKKATFKGTDLLLSGPPRGGPSKKRQTTKVLDAIELDSMTLTSSDVFTLDATTTTLTNSALLIGSSTLGFSGDLQISNDSTVTISSVTPGVDPLTVGGCAKLSGTLVLSETVDINGTAATLLTYACVEGAFNSIEGCQNRQPIFVITCDLLSALGLGPCQEPQYTATSLQIIIASGCEPSGVPVAAIVVPIIIGLLILVIIMVLLFLHSQPGGIKGFAEHEKI